MLLFNNEEKYATGLVKPKTTAIFFDKLLVTEDLLDRRLSRLGYTDIPNEILLRPNLSRFVVAHEISHFVMDMGIQEYSSDNIYSLFTDQTQVYKTSMNRNQRIYEVIEIYRQQLGINIVPIYFSPIEYEQYFLPSNNNVNQLSPTISICINQIPEIVEDKLTWEQVLQIRQDKESLKKVRRFNNWVTLELSNKSQSEISAILEKSIDEYSYALKKHGIKTTVGAISTIQSITTTIATAFTENTNFLVPGIMISTGVSVFAINSFIDSIEAKRHPIAIIYDLLKIK